MPSYLVTWEIDIDAETAHDAARQAHEIVRRPDTSANVYKVIEHDSSSETVTVDLEEDAPPPPPDWNVRHG
ncbi:hypothetical protein [Ochrobactrum soli]|uniref:Uncharacterized protein n=1 Tax=Ochrobactrum soli TaxID=2448455 RepID=A0A2P9HMN5_9HYPH|nr:hypothetical protein [[Ochrobactrum] soli]SPL65385.1 hypothetical protein OHAE_1252 [[Ochrobactrum] soli]